MRTQVVLFGFLTVVAGATAVGCSSHAPLETTGLAGSGTVKVLSHDLDVELSPSTHGLVARDRMTVANDGGDAERLTFILSRRLTVSRVGVFDGNGATPLSHRVKPAGSGSAASDRKSTRLNSSHSSVSRMPSSA